MRALASSIVAVFAVIAAAGLTACVTGEQDSTDRVSSVSSAVEGNPYDSEAQELLWCDWEWRFGGSPILGTEKTAMARW